MPRRLPFDLDNASILDPDADEVLLGLLARDHGEPRPKYGAPHRRWVRPPVLGLSHEDGEFRQVAPGWWRAETWVEIEAEQARRRAEQQERRLAEEVPRQTWVPTDAWPASWSNKAGLVETQRLIDHDG